MSSHITRIRAMSTSLVEQVQEQFYTYAQAATALGVSKVTLWHWIRRGKIEVHRLGREVLIEKRLVEELRRER